MIECCDDERLTNLFGPFVDSSCRGIIGAIDPYMEEDVGLGLVFGLSVLVEIIDNRRSQEEDGRPPLGALSCVDTSPETGRDRFVYVCRRRSLLLWDSMRPGESRMACPAR
jgi:hypothetical protein